MSTRLNVYVHHHGYLDSSKPSYEGGEVDTVNLDTDEFSFRDLEDFGKEFGYDPSSLVYFKTNGHTFADGVKVVYDDESVRELIDVSMSSGCIDLYIDHCFDFASPARINVNEENKTSKNRTESDDANCYGSKSRGELRALRLLS